MTLVLVPCRRGDLSRAKEFATALRGAEKATLAGSDDLQQGERTSPPRLPLIAISENPWRAIITSRPGSG
jgi:hypothetical protein